MKPEKLGIITTYSLTRFEFRNLTNPPKEIRSVRCDYRCPKWLLVLFATLKLFKFLHPYMEINGEEVK